jgi:hypothetical protein
MNRAAPASFVIALVTATALLCGLRGADLPKSAGAYVLAGSMASPLANQVTAADEKFVYVIDDAVVAKHDK